MPIVFSSFPNFLVVVVSPKICRTRKKKSKVKANTKLNVRQTIDLFEIVEELHAEVGSPKSGMPWVMACKVSIEFVFEVIEGIKLSFV